MAKRILVPLDGSPTAEQILPHVLALAAMTECEAHLLCVLEPGGHADDSLVLLSRELTARGLKTHSRFVHPTRVHEAILAAASEDSVDMIAICSHGRTGFERWYLGSVAEHVVRDCSVPVLLVRPGKEDWRSQPLPRYARILIPLDGSPFSEVALQYEAVIPLRPERVTLMQASEIPIFIGRELLDGDTLQSVMDDSQKYLESLAPTLPGVDVRCQVLDAMPAEAILELAGEGSVDLIVMATAGRSGLKRWLLGSVAEKVARRSPCPLLLLNPNLISIISAPAQER